MTEPVTAQTQRYVRCLWSLDRDLAYARHYPALSWVGSFSRDAPAVGAWHARERDPQWMARRARLAAILAEADRLGALAELMGPGALPPGQRVTLLAGRLIREGVLQQSSLSPVDSYCDAARGAALAGAVLAVADACQELAASGVAPTAIEEEDFSLVLRAREEAATAAEVDQRRDVMLARLAALATGHGPPVTQPPAPETAPAREAPA
jgi:V/A-type H+-transporting ATPase subunit A